MSFSGETVDVYIARIRITERDNTPYTSSFVHALAATERHLRKCLNFVKYEHLFHGVSTCEAFDTLAREATPAHEDAFIELRFADWGATTDGYLCFLLPVGGQLFVACAPTGGGTAMAAEVWPYDIIKTLEVARGICTAGT